MEINNTTTAQLVKEHLENNAFILDYLSRDLINVTSLAREILPAIKEQNTKATLESVSIAIKRSFASPNQKISEQLKHVLSNIQLNMRNDIVLLCLSKGAKLPNMSEFQSDDIFFVNQGSNEITVIIDRKNLNLIKGPTLLEQKDLALISLRDNLINEKINYRVTPGFVYSFISNIGREGININDILSTHSQVSFVVEQKYLLRVYQICQNVINLKYV
jgi:hypothetical protein